MRSIRIIFIFILFLVTTACNEKLVNVEELNKPINIFPDYTDITIPVNIAPLNFLIEEQAIKYHVEISAKNSKPIIIQQNSPKIEIPMKQWQEILHNNKEEILRIAIYLKKEKQWYKYNEITNSISSDSINPYLVYRLINTQYEYSYKMKLAQRNLENFNEYTIWENSSTNNGCFNCHSFSNYNANSISIHFRQSNSGTLIMRGDTIKKLETKTPYTMSPFGYAASNPDGDLIAYSVNKFNEYFTNSSRNLNEVTDQASDIVIYNTKTNIVTTSPKISTKNRENFPTWSPDGKWLYYLSASEAFDDFKSRFYGMYSLCRIEYDKISNKWGDVDTVFSAPHNKKSITFPRISPDGKHLLFNLIDYGYFSINHKESDLYLMVLETRNYHKLGINSNSNDSYHTWSKNGKWIVFSSKRYNDIFTAPYFSFFDDSGSFHKPFILPQKDPAFYKTFLTNYNIPELVDSKVNLNPIKIRNLLYGDSEQVVFDSTVNIDALSGATWIRTHN